MPRVANVICGRSWRVAGVVVSIGAGAALLRHQVGPGTHGHRVVVQRARRLSRALDRVGRRWSWAVYRTVAGRPDPYVSDAMLADRIRSSLGPLLARLDLPRIHVACAGHLAILHGDVASADQASQIVEAVRHTRGVADVRSRLHVGLLAGDTGPSEGRRPRPSIALRQLCESAVAAGADPDEAVSVAVAVIRVLADELPRNERQQLVAHLPADVRDLVGTGTHRGSSRHGRRVGDLIIDVVTTTKGIPLGRAEHVLESVLGTLHELVPEETRDVAAVLPDDLRRFWEAAVPG